MSKGTIRYPESSREAALLVGHFVARSADFKWVAVKDLDEAELRLPGEAGETLKGVATISKYLAQHTTTDQSPVDEWLSGLLKIENAVEYSEKLNHHLQLRTFIVGHQLSLADVAVHDTLTKLPQWTEISSGKTTPHLLRWAAHLDSLPILGGRGRSASEKPKKSASEAPSKGLAGWHGSYDTDRLPGAVEGKVVTRFPPEPSGYLHVGHIKAAMLNSFYATMYKGKLLLRFDDTNPAKEKDDYVDNIIEDLGRIGISFQSVTYTSDYFDQLEKYAEQLLKLGKAFIDDTPLEQMRAERRVEGTNEGVESRCRNQSVEENLRLFNEMKAGSPIGLKCVMRAKIDMKSKNAALRDPSLYRCSGEAHYRMGTKYKAYPLYDFACPIVDSIEGVTHALRSSEYHDRNPLYNWVLDALNLRKPHIEDFSRLNFKYVLLSKRKLQKLVDLKLVDGWSDPRFPTVQGILRRGMTVEALREFILAQGASKSLNLMTMDKLWAINKKVIDPVVPRYTALTSSRVSVTLTNSPAEPNMKSVPRHKKNPDLGNKVVTYQNRIFIDLADAKDLKENEEITLMDWGNAIIKTITKDGTGVPTAITADLNLAGDFKTTEKKLTWLADIPDLIPVVMRDYSNLITKEKLDEGDDFEKFINPKSLDETTGVADPALRTLNKGDRIQLERRGYFIVDAPFTYPDHPLVLVQIPDGRSTDPAEKEAEKVAAGEKKGKKSNKPAAK